MRRGTTLGTTVALAAIASVAAGGTRLTPQPSDRPSRRPNIIWISNEDMSPRLGAYGDPVARTPVLDRLARESVRYTRAFTTAPVCAPSRAAIITGMYQTAIGAQHMRTTEDRVPELPGPYLAVPPFYVKAFPEYLRAAGYYTTNRAKTDYQFGVPFTIWDDLGTNAHWRNRPDKGQPFFSVFNLVVTHESQIFPSSPARKGKVLVTDPAKLQVPPYYPDTPAVREELARMYDNIADMDRQVGEILRQLEDDGLAESTIVFYWSDHGDGVPRAKRSLYDSGLRVPLMIRCPRSLAPTAVPGSMRDELVSFIDLAPTVLALAGLEIPAHLPGRILVGPAAAPAPPFVFAARDRMDIEYDMMRSARDARFLYIRNFSPELPYAGHVIYRNQSAIMQDWLRLQAERKLTGPPALWMRTHRPPEELYDTKADPHQILDLSADPAHRGTLARMRGAVTEWMARTGDQGLINEPEMIQRMWPGGVQPETAQPYIVPRRTTDTPARQAAMRIEGPTEVVIYVPTQGASIGYTTDDGPNAKWRLYTGPILVDGPMTLRAKAIRYGYKESAETRVLFTKESAEREAPAIGRESRRLPHPGRHAQGFGSARAIDPQPAPRVGEHDLVPGGPAGAKDQFGLAEFDDGSAADRDLSQCANGVEAQPLPIGREERRGGAVCVHGSHPRAADDGGAVGVCGAAVSNAPSSARRMSWMSPRRCFGSFWRQRFRNAAIVGERSRGRRPHSGSLPTTETIVSVRSSPGNARAPVSISNRTTPNAQMSARLSTGRPLACSGAM